MAKVPLVSGYGFSQAAGISRYFEITMSGATATEAGSQFTTRIAGTLSNLFVYISANSSNYTTTLRLRKNTANGNQVISITAAATGQFEDISNTDTLTSGDIVNYSSITGAGTGTITLQNISILFEATTNLVNFYNTSGNFVNTASQTSYWQLSAANINTTESNVLLVFKNAGTFKNLFVKITQNNRSTATTYTVRQNAADTTITLSVTGSTTGIFEDTSHTATISVDDTSAFKIITGTGTGSVTHGLITISFETTNSIIPIHFQSTASRGFGTTTYHGFYTTSDTTEANSQIEANVAFVASKLGARVNANTANGTSTYLLRQNAADTALSTSITASTTGWFIDTSNTVSIAATDEINRKLVVGGSSGSLTVIASNMLLDYNAGSSSIKSINGLAKASVKSVNGLAIASVKNYNGLA